MNRQHLFLLCIMLLAQPCLAATLSGTAYTPELQVAKFSLLTINTTPAQRIILEDGTYNITVPRGAYLMRIELSSKGKLYDDEMVVEIKDSGYVRNTGNYTYDFILFPSDANATDKMPSVDDLDVAEPEPTPIVTPIAKQTPWTLILLPIAIIVLLGGMLYMRSKKRVVNTEPQVVNADLDQVIKLVKNEGGRTTQKELRKHIACSEAKLSMMLTELEESDKIKKIKKGRGNLIVLK